MNSQMSWLKCCKKSWTRSVSIMKRLFIVGVGRSGTSLLQSMMAAHSKIVMMPETSFVRRYLVTSLLSIKSKATTYNFGEDTY